MKRVQLAVLLVVLAVFAIVAFRRAVPRIMAQRSSVRAAKVEAPVEHKPLGANRRLADGSFNPNPARKMKPAEDPRALLADNWRARYKSLLDEVRPAGDRPGIYVYSFLDRTPEGVGTQFTYGWHLVGSAALESWTNARIASAEPPAHYGLPEIDERATTTLSTPSPEEWIRRALGDPATAGARYVITGVYDHAPQSNQYTLTIRLTDRKMPAADGGIVLFESASARRGDFETISAVQRRAAREMTDKLVSLGIVEPRRPPKGAKPQLDAELDRVAALLDSADSWTVMDGIDQALALQAIYPAETLPLQAAAYGINSLRWAYFGYVISNDYKTDYALRGYALAQVALAMDPKPAMSHLNWIQPLRIFNILPETLLKSITGEDVTRKNMELDAYRRCVVDEYQGAIQTGYMLNCPDWTILYLENRQTMFDGRPHEGRPFLRDRVAEWPKHDLYLVASILDMTAPEYETADKAGFYARAKASVQLTRASFAGELATIMSAQRLPREDCEFLADLIGAEDRDMRELAEERDYYRTREYLLDCLRSWNETPDSAGHPVFKVLAWAEKRAAALIADPNCAAARSGYAGFEFTAAERVRFAHRRDHQGPMMYASFLDGQLGSYEQSTKLASMFVDICPTNAMAQYQLGDFLERRIEENLTISFQRRNAFKAAYANLPLNDYTPYLIGRSCFYTDDVPQGLAYIRQFARQNPFSTSRPYQIAQLYKRYGYHAMAVKYYDETLRAMPKRYDIANERAWSLCQMGRWEDRELRETFARPVKLLPGNSSFHEANLDYLYSWCADTTASREAVAFYRQCKPGSDWPIRWIFNIERFDGKTSKALEILEQNLEPSDDVHGLARAVHYAFVASRYLDLNMPAKAKPYIQKAAAIDSWQGNVIRVMADYAFVTKDYDEAISEYRREIERYGHNSDLVRGIARCYEKKGMNEKAISLLEDEMLNKSRHSSVMMLAPYLMYLYAEKSDKEKGKLLMDKVLDSSQRSRALISNTLDSYKKLDPKEAADIRARMNEIMAGPNLEK